MSESAPKGKGEGGDARRRNSTNSVDKRFSSIPPLSATLEDFPPNSMDLITSVYRILKFERPLCHYARHARSFLDSVAASHKDILSSSQLHYNPYDESSSSLDTVLSLVIDKPFWTSGAGDEPESVPALLNALLYPAPHRHGSFTESVWNGSIDRACVSAAVCEAVLVDSVSERNCFSLLSVALESGSEVLAHVCLKTCLSRFVDAIDHDRDGFVALSLRDVSFLLQHDGLNLNSNEEDALAAICIWVEADLVNRLNDFVPLFATGIRFSEIDYYSLAEMVDACDLVSYHHAATELAAHELIQKTMGWSKDNALGMGTIARPRRPIAGSGGMRERGERAPVLPQVYHTRGVLQRLMHVQDSEIVQGMLHGMLQDVLKAVVAGGDDVAFDLDLDLVEADKENSEKTRNGTKGYDKGDDEPNMFSRALSVEFMMVSPSHRSFGSSVNLPATAAATAFGGLADRPTRSIMDPSNYNDFID